MEAIIQSLQTTISNLETKVQRQEKALRKMKKDMIPEDQRVQRKPSGFAKATYMSPTLCTFLGVDQGTELPRTEVTKRVLAYVKEHNLQNPESKRIINMDDNLRKLLNPEPDEVVTYFSIQRLMKVHYIKPDNTDSSTSTSTSTPAPAPAPAPEPTPTPAAKKKRTAK